MFQKKLLNFLLPDGILKEALADPEVRVCVGG